MCGGIKEFYEKNKDIINIITGIEHLKNNIKLVKDLIKFSVEEVVPFLRDLINELYKIAKSIGKRILYMWHNNRTWVYAALSTLIGGIAGLVATIASAPLTVLIATIISIAMFIIGVIIIIYDLFNTPEYEEHSLIKKVKGGCFYTVISKGQCFSQKTA